MTDDVSTLESAQKWLGDKYKEYIKDPVRSADLNKDGKADLEQFQSWLQQKGGDVQSTASSAWNTIRDNSKEPLEMLSGWAKDAQKAAGEAVSEDGFLNKNKGALGGLIGLGLLGMLLTGNIMGALILALVGFLGGSLMDGKGGILGSLFGGEDKPQTPGGTSPGQSGPEQSRAQVQGQVQAQIALDGNGAAIQDVAQSTTVLKGRFTGEGENRQFIVESMVQNRNNALEEMDVRSAAIALKANGNQIVATPQELVAARDQARNAALADPKPVQNVTFNAPLAGIIAPAVAAAAPAPEAPAAAAPAQPAAPTTTAPDAPATAGAAVAPAEMPAMPASANPTNPANAARDGTNTPAPGAANTPSSPPAITSLDVVGTDGKPISRIMLDASGKPVSDEASAIVIAIGRYEAGGELFRIQSSSARYPDGSFKQDSLAAIPGSLSKMTLEVKDGKIDLTNKRTEEQLSQVSSEALARRDAAVEKQALKDKAERFTKLSKAPEIVVLDSQKIEGGKDLITFRYTGLTPDNKEFSAILTAEGNVTTSINETRGTGVQWAETTRTVSTSGNLTIASGKLLGGDGKPIGENFIDVNNPISLSSLPVANGQVMVAALPRLKGLEASASREIAALDAAAQTNKPIAAATPNSVGNALAQANDPNYVPSGMGENNAGRLNTPTRDRGGLTMTPF